MSQKLLTYEEWSANMDGTEFESRLQYEIAYDNYVEDYYKSKN